MKQGDEYQTIRDIADAICEEQVTPEQIKELEQLLKGNPEAKRFYIDYISIHTYLSSAVQNNMEFVYRRIQTAEEFIVRPSGEITAESVDLNQSDTIDPSHEHPKSDKLISDNSSSSEPSADLAKKTTRTAWRFAKFSSLILVLCLIVAILTWFAVNKDSNKSHAEIMDGHLTIVDLGHINMPYLDVGEYEVKQDTHIKLVDGVVIQLVKHSIFKLLNNNKVELKRGQISVINAADSNLIVHGPSFSLHANGSDFSLDLRSGKPIVSTGEKTLLLPNSWRPMHYWSFDHQTDRAIDSAGLAHGIVSFRATRTQGLIGRGAYSFDARIDVGSGGGTVPATGSFAVTDGVTIEALVRPEFSASVGDNDEIFRKDRADQDLRMLLSFQQDKQHKTYLMPDGDYKNKESLSFGLYLLGQGYQELKLPLDGLEGRPTLAELKDGNTHHIVATYNVKTGLKAIYVDGVQHAAYQYPAGSKMLSGGPGTANIGNSPNYLATSPKSDSYSNEAFSGVIDEVTFYNFALPEFMVQQHNQNINQGTNYFGLLPSLEKLPEKIELKLPSHSRIELEPLTGLPKKVKNKD